MVEETYVPAFECLHETSATSRQSGQSNCYAGK